MEKDLIYTNKLTKNEILYTLKVLFSYIGIITVWFAAAHIYMNFGKWIYIAVSGMWIAGAIGVFKIPEEREHTIKETKFAIIAYVLFLLLYRFVIQQVSGYSSGQMSASFGINISTVDGTTISRTLQGILVMVSVLTPIGFVLWIGQKFKTFRGRNTKHEELNELKGFKKDRRVR